MSDAHTSAEILTAAAAETDAGRVIFRSSPGGGHVDISPEVAALLRQYAKRAEWHYHDRGDDPPFSETYPAELALARAILGEADRG